MSDDVPHGWAKTAQVERRKARVAELLATFRPAEAGE